MAEHPKITVDDLTLSITLQDPRTNKHSQVELPFRLAWSLHRITAELGITYTVGAGLVGVFAATGGKLTDNAQERLDIIIRGYAQSIVDKWPRAEDMLLQVSHRGLQEGIFNRVTAAAFASELLGEEIDPETWRKRTNAFAKLHDLGGSGLSPGRPRKKTGK